MAAGVQFLNQYFLLWAPLLFLGSAALILFVCRASRRWWLAWGAALVAAAATLFSLRTSSGTLSHYAVVGGEAGQAEDQALNIEIIRELFDPKSIEEIEAALATSDGKPTLVEFYTDVGLG